MPKFTIEEHEKRMRELLTPKTTPLIQRLRALTQRRKGGIGGTIPRFPRVPKI